MLQYRITLLFLSNHFSDAICLGFHNQLKLLLVKCPCYRFIILIFYFVSSGSTIKIASTINTSSLHISMVNLTKSPTLNLVLFLRLWESLFSLQVYTGLSFVIFTNIFRSHFDISDLLLLYFDAMSWRISIYFLALFFVKYRNMIPLMIRFNLSTICLFHSLSVANSLMLLSAK